MVQRREGMVEDVICDVSTLRNALRLIERPMDAEVNPALAILFLGLRERREVARHVRANIAVVVLGDSVEFIRYKHERDVIGAEESA